MHKTRNMLALLVCASFLAGFMAMPSGASAQDQVISYAETADAVLIETGDMEVAISKTFPAAMIIHSDQEDPLGYGVVISAVFGYNATEDGMLVLEDVPYRASLEHATWSLSDITHETNADMGETVTVDMTASLDMNRRIASFEDDRSEESGTPGIEIIEDWAQAKVSFIVTSDNYSAHYADVQDSPDYDVNGSTELKFDISIDIDEAIYAEDLAIDIGLMMMENYTFSPTSMPEQYFFQGYQDDAITESDPYENETDGTVKIVHKFTPRSDFKQLFAFVEEGEKESFFGWASQAEIGWTGDEDELVDIATLYRTDGESLRVYLSTPLNDTTISVMHDPSLGLFPIGQAEIPGDIIPVGTSGESVVIGVTIGVVVVGTIGAYAVARRTSDEDPADVVSLEKNRYYRKKT
jgi:hypothetical protein